MMANFNVRQSTLADEEVVSTLLEFSYSKLMRESYAPGVLVKLLPIIGKANPALLRSGTFYLAETGNGVIVGAGGWTKQRPDDGDRSAGVGHLRHFATHPSWIGQGVGRAVFDRCLSDAQSSRIDCFHCYASLNAVDFYAKLGFIALRQIDIPIDRSQGSEDGLSMRAMFMERQL